MRRTPWLWLVFPLVFATVQACNCGRVGPTRPPDGGLDGGQDAGVSDGGTRQLPDGGLCPAFEIACGATCVDPRVDPSNCGGCGNVCAGATACSAGVCESSCQTPLQICGHSCVDFRTDNAHCGSCGNTCDAGQGCVNGSCQAAVLLGPPPAQCANGGPPVVVSDDAGRADCAGNLAQRTFRWALCSCNSLSTSSTLLADAFDSTHGPYVADGGPGAGVGTNGSLTCTGPYFTVSGSLWATDGGLPNTQNINVGEDLYVGGDWTAKASQIAGNAWVTGNIAASGGASAVAGTLNLNPGATVTGTFSAGTTVQSAPVTVPSACDCSPGQIVPVASIVAAHAASNDNALIGLDAGVFASATVPATRLDLPCGNYYLSGITTSSPVAIEAHGNVGLFIGGNVTTNTLQLTLDPSSQLDIFIAGGVCNSGGLELGNPNYPAQLRLYAGGNNACGTPGDSIRLSGPNTSFAGNLYAVNGFGLSSASTDYGAIFAGAYSNSASAVIHYDKAVLSQGTLTCGDGGTSTCSSCQDCNDQACIRGQCGACRTDADCCAPLLCNQGRCVASSCTGSGQGCSSSSACCTGLLCLTADSAFCSGADAGCTCH